MRKKGDWTYRLENLQADLLTAVSEHPSTINTVRKGLGQKLEYQVVRRLLRELADKKLVKHMRVGKMELFWK